MNKTVDNFRKIESLLDFPTDDVFYFGQIIIRRKDDPTVGADNKVLRDLFFESKEKLWDKEREIKGYCEYTGARAYIHLNKRSKEAVAFECLKIMADRISKKEYQSLRSVYATACGQKVNDPDKKWILDFDSISLEKQAEILLCIENKLRPYDEPKIIASLPTVNGRHVICRPFDIKAFREEYPTLTDQDMSIQKNNPTLLYYSRK